MSEMTDNSRAFVRSDFQAWVFDNPRIRALQTEVALRIDELYKERERAGLPYVLASRYERDGRLQIKKAIIPILRTAPMNAKQRARIAQFGVEAVAEVIAGDVWDGAYILTGFGEPSEETRAYREQKGVSESARSGVRPPVVDIELDDENDGDDY